MEEKYNDSTVNRPAGDRVIDAASLLIDLPSVMAQLHEEVAWRKNDRNAITLYKASGLRLVLTALHAGAVLPPHEAEGVMSMQVIQGLIHCSTSDKNMDVRERQLVALHAGVTYSISAEEDSVLLLTLSGGAPEVAL